MSPAEEPMAERVLPLVVVLDEIAARPELEEQIGAAVVCAVMTALTDACGDAGLRVRDFSRLYAIPALSNPGALIRVTGI